VLAWCVVGLVVAAAGAAARWWLRPADALGRPRRFPAITVALLVVLAAVLAVPVWRHDRLQDRLGAAASALTGSPVQVHCQGAGEEFVDAGPELGRVEFGPDGRPEPRTVLRRQVCASLQAFVDRSGRAPSRDEVVAVHVLTHETRHLAGVVDEARAECEAVQRDAATARLLGAHEADALRLARLYWGVEYRDLPEGYRSADCAPGGRWDEHLPDPPWAR
jgi:hypothetical protein